MACVPQRHLNALRRVWPLIVLLAAVFFWIAPANALTKERAEFLKATDAVITSVGDHRKAVRTLLDHQKETFGNPVLARDPDWRAKDGQLRARVTVLAVRAARAKAVQGKALDALRKVLQPYSKLRTKALRSLRAIRVGGGHQANRKAAQDVIVRDINKLNGPTVNGYMGAIKAAQDLVKAGRPQETVKSTVVDALKDLPIGKEMADAVMDVVNELYKDNFLSKSDRLKLLDDRLGQASKAMKALNILNGGTDSPFGDETLVRLANIYDLALDFVPSDGSLAGLKAYALFQKSMIEDIVKSVERLDAAIAAKNLDALVLGAARPVHLDRKSKWVGLTPGRLFGDIEVEAAGAWFVKVAPPLRSPLGEKFVAGDKVQITFGWQVSDKDKTWLWVGPADHGDPRNYWDARQNFTPGGKVIKAYPQAKEGHVLQKVVRVMVGAGTYEARLYLDRKITVGGRTRLISTGKKVRFNVVVPPWTVWLNRTDYLAGDRVQVFYLAPHQASSYPWVGIVPPSIAPGSGTRNAQHAIASRRIHDGRGILTFTAPANASKYDARMNTGSMMGRGSNKEVASTSFYVVATPTPKINLDKSVLHEGEDLLLNYEGSKGYANTAYIGVYSPGMPGYGLNETPAPGKVSPFLSFLGRSYRMIGGSEVGRLNFGSRFFANYNGDPLKYTVRMFDGLNGKQVAMNVFEVRRKPAKPGTVRATLRGKTATKKIR